MDRHRHGNDPRLRGPAAGAPHTLPSRLRFRASNRGTMAALRIGPLLSLLVVAELQRGDLTAARHAADRLEQMAEEADVASLVVDGHVARARVLAGSGDEAAAIARSGDRAGAVAEARAALACFERLGADAFRDQVAALLRSLGDTSRARPQRATKSQRR